MLVVVGALRLRRGSEVGAQIASVALASANKAYHDNERRPADSCGQHSRKIEPCLHALWPKQGEASVMMEHDGGQSRPQ